MRYLRLALSLVVFTSVYARTSEVVVFQPTLTNVEGVPADDLKLIIQDLNKSTYSDLDEIAERVRFAFQKRGYFKVQVAEPSIATDKEKGGKRTIYVRLAVTAGEKYRLRDIAFSSSSVFQPTQLRAAFSIEDGDVFDREKIGVGLENLRKLYGTRGHVDFSAVPETEISDDERTVALKIDLDEGPIYSVGSLTVAGVESEPGAREKLLKTWRAYEGQVYDWQILERFLRDLHARPQVRPDQLFEISQDTEKHVVNVYITLARPIF